MSFAFGEVQPMIFARLGVELVDVRSLSGDAESQVRSLWHSGMKGLLDGDTTFPFKETCINEQACLGTLNNAYVDHVEAERRLGREPLTYEAFSRANFDRLGVPDYISKPHMDLHWFGIRIQGQRDFSGALMISNIESVKADSRLLTLCGWPVVVHPAIGAADEATVAGAINRFVMDTNLITVDPRGADVDFVQWHLPTSLAGRYVARGTNTYGRDVFEEMADGVKVRFGDATIEDAPINIKRELQPADDPAEFPDYTRPVRTASAEPIRER